jgi:hypothetical protein
MVSNNPIDMLGEVILKLPRFGAQDTTSTCIVVIVAHWPGPGVKVYAPLDVLLITGGYHVPVISNGVLVDEIGNIGEISPAQIGAIEVNVGVMIG